MPIAWYLPLVLAALVLAAALPVVLLGYLGASDNTSRLLRDRVELVLDVVVDRVAAHMDPVRDQLGYVADAVRRGALDSQDASAMDTFLAGAVAATPQVTALAFARADGSVRVRNRADHRSFEERIEALSAVRRSLADARPRPGPSWVGPFWSEALKQPLLAFRQPLTDTEGRDVGTLVATVSVADLSRSMAGVADDIGQTPFILVGRDHVLAHPTLAAPRVTPVGGPDQPLARIEAFEDPVLARLWSREARPLSAFQSLRRAQGHWSWFEPDSFAANTYVYRSVTDYGVEPWTVGVHLPSAETRRERWIVAGIGLGGLVLLVLALGVAFMVAGRLGKPVLGLAGAAARVEALDFSNVAPLPRSPVREINQAAAAVERMAKGLAWFETYLPKTLVRRLMVAGAGSQRTETREVTVMFTDLESYSDFSASRPAAEVVSYLNDLLARVGPIIEAGGGTIDKYIGDSVMAFWGAPEERADHARTACLAACAIAREVETFNAERRSAGQHACRMRIGLHTGPVAVGNVGFSGRVDYTIIGRVVNVAQRFEHCGREVDDGGEVVILASTKTAADAGDDLSWASCPDIEIAGAGVALRCLPTVAPLEEGRASSFSPRGS